MKETLQLQFISFSADALKDDQLWPPGGVADQNLRHEVNADCPTTVYSSDIFLTEMETKSIIYPLTETVKKRKIFLKRKRNRNRN